MLIKLFDAYLGVATRKACDALRLLDIDAYDHRNQERLQKLQGRVDDAALKRLASRLANRRGRRSAARSIRSLDRGHGEHRIERRRREGAALQTLEDLIVQTEIFLQYSLHNKALERLQKIGVMFPGEEKRNPRLCQFVRDWQIGGRRERTGNSPAKPVRATPVAPAVAGRRKRQHARRRPECTRRKRCATCPRSPR